LPQKKAAFHAKVASVRAEVGTRDRAAQAGISRATFTKRRNAGWSLERIISTPPKKNKKAV